MPSNYMLQNIFEVFALKIRKFMRFAVTMSQMLGTGFSFSQLFLIVKR